MFGAKTGLHRQPGLEALPWHRESLKAAVQGRLGAVHGHACDAARFIAGGSMDVRGSAIELLSFVSFLCCWHRLPSQRSLRSVAKGDPSFEERRTWQYPHRVSGTKYHI